MTSAEFVDCWNLPSGTLLDVETKNRHYRIEWLGVRQARISGHPELCPTPVNCEVEGSADKAGVVEPGLIGRGRYLKFLMDDHRPVTTSRVLRVRVQRPDSVH